MTIARTEDSAPACDTALPMVEFKVYPRFAADPIA